MNWCLVLMSALVTAAVQTWLTPVPPPAVAPPGPPEEGQP